MAVDPPVIFPPAASCGCQPFTALARELADAKALLATATAELDRRDEALATMRYEHSDLLAEHDALKSQATQAGRDVARLKAELAAAREERVSLEAVIADQRERLAAITAEMAAVELELAAEVARNTGWLEHAQKAEREFRELEKGWSAQHAELAAAREALRVERAAHVNTITTYQAVDAELTHVREAIVARHAQLHPGYDFEACREGFCGIARAALDSTPPRGAGEQGEVERREKVLLAALGDYHRVLVKALVRSAHLGCGPMSSTVAIHETGCWIPEANALTAAGLLLLERALTARTGGGK